MKELPASCHQHVIANYLDENKPELLGGRACGLQGMCGSKTMAVRDGVVTIRKTG